MTQKDNILQELNELKSSLVAISKKNIYTVPVGYFDGLADQTLNRIKAMETLTADEELDYLSPMLKNISKQVLYTVPSGYFEELQKNLLQSVGESCDYKTAKEELETLSPLLSGLKKEMPYSVPQGYFEQLASTISKEEHTSVTRIVAITSRKWFRYAAAAIITGIIATAGFLYTNNKTTNDPAKSLVKFEKKLNKEIEKTSDKELDEFIQQFSDAGLNGEEKVHNQTDSEVKELLKDVSETELKEFLEETADTESTTDEPSLMN
jgi:hypothetical protein